MRIQDGKGKGYEAKVDNYNKLHTRSVTVSSELVGALLYNQFGINTTAITLTSANESALLYAYWADPAEHMILSRQVMSFGPSTGGSGQVRIRIIRNPTGGTLISAGTAITPVNNNFASSLTANGTWKKGAEGSTVTGGLDMVDVGTNSGSILVVSDIDWVVPNGSSYVIAITPPTGNTSMKVYLHDKFYSINPDNY